MRIETSILFTASLALAGCIPLQFEYYLPHASSGTLEAEHGECNDVKDVIVFSYPEQGMRLTFHVFPSRKGDDSLRLSIQKTSWTYQTVTKADGSTTNRANWSGAKASVIDFAAGHVTFADSTGKTQNLPLQLPGDGGTRLLLSTDQFSRTLSLPSTANGYFDIDMPAIDVDGSVLDIPRIHFERQSVTAMTGINC